MKVIEAELSSPIGELYLERLRIHINDSYRGLPMLKFPEDLRVIEELMWELEINVVLEIGLWRGGGALWFRDRLRTLAEYGRIDQPLVVAVDRNISEAQSALMGVDPNYAKTIKLVESDIRSPSVREAVCRHIPADARVLVIDDSAHRYDTSLATLTTFADLVPVGGYVLIEDGHRDIEGMLPPEISGEARGVLDAIEDFLAGDGADRFVRRRDQERYVLTSHPGGWIQRVR
ncbi:MAG: hypothetical protein J2P17_02010 [Mycobacterium sp.]|nr:hypothetical protein [Mycobacterium sp.]